MDFAALESKELVLLAVALLGIVPVVFDYRPQSRRFTAGYLLLATGAIVSNLETLAFEGVLDLVEHAVGVTGSGAAFLAAAYYRRQSILADGEGEQ